MVTSQTSFTLTAQIKYPGKDGHVEAARNIVLFAPTVRSMKAVAPIKQMFMQAIISSLDALEGLGEIAEKQEIKNTVEKKEKDKGLDGESICQMLCLSEKIKYDEFLTKFIDILLNPALALIDGEVQLTGSFLDQLPMDELEGLVGEYLANFIAPSAMTT